MATRAFIRMIVPLSYLYVTYTIYGGNVTGVSVKADNFMNRAKVAKWIKGSRYVEISGAYRDLSKNKWVDAKTSLYLM